MKVCLDYPDLPGIGSGSTDEQNYYGSDLDLQYGTGTTENKLFSTSHSVPDPSPEDPELFGPTGSGSSLVKQK
jgi:hypothetical protein